MTPVSEFMIDAAPDQAKEMVDGSHLALRAAQRLIGFALLLASAGLWLQPGANWDIDLAVMKLGLSAFLALAAVAVLNLGRAGP